MASGLFGLTLEKCLIDTLGESYEAEDNKILMTEAAYTQAFDTHDFRADVTDEVSGAGYSAGGAALTSTEITLASGVLKFDAADVTWSSSTIPDASKAVHYFETGNAATDALGFLSEFSAPASSAGGDFVIQWHANGIFTIDYTP
jgi:hypothetical protein